MLSDLCLQFSKDGIILENIILPYLQLQGLVYSWCIYRMRLIYWDTEYIKYGWQILAYVLEQEPKAHAYVMIVYFIKKVRIKCTLHQAML